MVDLFKLSGCKSLLLRHFKDLEAGIFLLNLGIGTYLLLWNGTLHAFVSVHFNLETTSCALLNHSTLCFHRSGPCFWLTFLPTRPSCPLPSKMVLVLQKASLWLSSKRIWDTIYPWVGKISWRRKWQPTPVFFLGKSHGQRSLAGYSP